MAAENEYKNLDLKKQIMKVEEGQTVKIIEVKAELINNILNVKAEFICGEKYEKLKRNLVTLDSIKEKRRKETKQL